MALRNNFKWHYSITFNNLYVRPYKLIIQEEVCEVVATENMMPQLI